MSSAQVSQRSPGPKANGIVLAIQACVNSGSADFNAENIAGLIAISFLSNDQLQQICEIAKEGMLRRARFEDARNYHIVARAACDVLQQRGVLNLADLSLAKIE